MSGDLAKQAEARWGIISKIVHHYHDVSIFLLKNGSEPWMLGQLIAVSGNIKFRGHEDIPD